MEFVLSLCAAVGMMFLQQLNYKRQLRIRAQQDKVIRALLNYPAQHYSMAHMLERCLAIILPTSPYSAFVRGGIYLQQNDALLPAAHRATGLRAGAKLAPIALDVAPPSPVFRFVAADKRRQSGHYTVPLEGRNGLLGLLVLYTRGKGGAAADEAKYVNALGQTLAALIERKQNNEQLRVADSVIELSQQAILITDKHNRIIRCNAACEKITGFSAAELLGQNPKLLRSDCQSEFFYREMWHSIRENGFWQGEIWNRHKNGTLFAEWLSISAISDSRGEIDRYLAIFTDLTQIKQAEKDIRRLAFFDPLTQLPNRAAFNEHIQEMIVRAEREGRRFALLCLDIDHFKNINDSLGHQAGDKLLQLLAGRIEAIMPKQDYLARLGGDEFGMTLSGYHAADQSNLLPIVDRILSGLGKPVQLDGHEFNLSGSIGISYFPDDADNAADLIRYADSAMFQAKQAGRNACQFHSAHFNAQTLRKIRTESALRQALKQGDFEVHLQAQLDLHSKQVIGAEALLRVRRGWLQTLSPADYIPVAEESGLIVEIGDWVFGEVCRLLRAWLDAGTIPPAFKRVAVNISPLQFKRYDFIDKIRRQVADSGVPVDYLELELTEGALQESTQTVVEKLIALKRMGINIAIDDFGTGYSSLSRLKQFPIDLLKIDRSFVSDLCVNQSDMAIVKAIVSMARALNIKTLAEGVESQAQANALQALQCDYSQGYLHGRPVAGDRFAEQLAFGGRLANAAIPFEFTHGELNA